MPEDALLKDRVPLVTLASHTERNAEVTLLEQQLQDAKQQGEFALSTQAVNNANSLQQNASQAVISERSLFLAYEDAVAQHDEGRTADARGLMDPATLRTIDWWLDQPSESRPSSQPPQMATPR